MNSLNRTLPGSFHNCVTVIRRLGFIGLLVAATLEAATVSFDDGKPGQLLPGWTSGVTGKGTSNWTVESESTAPSRPNVLKQSGVATFPICIKDNTFIKDGFAEVKLKPVSGKEDQAGGLIWRCRDADNYYVARANALEDNVTIYHTINGRRVSFKTASTKVAPGVWHTLRVDFDANKFTVTFDGEKVITASDDSLTEGGKVGLWTKADSVTLFDDFVFGGKE